MSANMFKKTYRCTNVLLLHPRDGARAPHWDPVPAYMSSSHPVRYTGFELVDMLERVQRDLRALERVQRNILALLEHGVAPTAHDDREEREMERRDQIAQDELAEMHADLGLITDSE